MLNQANPVQTRHYEISDDQIRVDPWIHLDGGGSIWCEKQLVAQLVFQNRVQENAGVRLVIDYQYSGHTERLSVAGARNSIGFKRRASCPSTCR